MSIQIFSSINIPTLLLQYGVLVGLLLAAIVGFSWQREMTIVLFFVSAVCVAFSALRFGLPKPRLLDILFLSFFALVLISMAQQGWAKPGVSKNFFFIPLMILAPYICGRFTVERDIKQLIRWLLALTVVALLIFTLILVSDSNEIFQYRPLINGSDEITARLATLLAYAGITLAYLLTRQIAGVIRFINVFAKKVIPLILITLLIIFLGIRGVLLVFLLTLLLTAYSATWLSKKTIFISGLLMSALVVVAIFFGQQASEANYRMVTGALD